MFYKALSATVISFMLSTMWSELPTIQCAEVLVNGRKLDAVFGTRGRDWMWHCGGVVDIAKKKAAVELMDLTGFDGRCDAIFFTTDRTFIPPHTTNSKIYSWRKKLLALPDAPPSAGEFDGVVVGGGIAGCSASLAAARLGCRVALIQNHPVLGGNASVEFNESLAPESADHMTHENTIMFISRKAAKPVTFPEVPWAIAVSKSHAATGNRTHMWEYGQWLDSTVEAEHIRDYLLRTAFGAFATAKKRNPEKNAALELAWLSHVPGAGESRRLMGDHILTENDRRTRRKFPDAVAQTLTPFCLHLPRPETADGKHLDFLNGAWHFEGIRGGPASIPFRSLYSRNVGNLMMAGRCASATHVAYSSIKLMKTGGRMGVAAGCAAYLCMKEGVKPRELCRKHLKKLTDLVFERNEFKNALVR